MSMSGIHMFDTLFEYIGEVDIGFYDDKWVLSSLAHKFNHREMLYVMQPVIKCMGHYGINYLHSYVCNYDEFIFNFKKTEGSFYELNDDIEEGN